MDTVPLSLPSNDLTSKFMDAHFQSKVMIEFWTGVFSVCSIEVELLYDW